MRLSLRALPASLFARMVLILLLGLLTAQMVSIWLQWGERASVVSEARGQNFIERIVEAVRVLEADDPARRKDTLATLQYGAMQVTLIGADQVSPNAGHRPMQAMINARLGVEHEIRVLGEATGSVRQWGRASGMQQRANARRGADVQLRDGQWVRFRFSDETAAPALSNELIARLLITLAIISAVVMVAVRQATRPLQQLASAADLLGRDLYAPPLLVEGPTETRRAAQAFNRMQERIKRLISERARALASVSHDLRTPLTRLRLRAELVEDEKLRDQLAADIEAMAAMIDVTLDYLRGLQDNEALRAIDINALLASMSEDALVLGRTVRVEGRAGAPYSARLSALRRALQNLIDNAIKYGDSVQVRVDDSATELRISVEDQGPGIAPEEIAKVTEPYYRPDASRNSATGGAGLGLSIVKDIALGHGGELLLQNRSQGGLCATLRLPRA